MFGWYFTLTRSLAPGLYSHHMARVERGMTRANERAARRHGVTPPVPAREYPRRAPERAWGRENGDRERTR